MIQYKPGAFAIVPCMSVRGLDPYSQTVYMWLYHHAGGKASCYPSVSTLMAECGIKSRSGVQSAIKTLELKGLVKKQEREKDGTNETNMYDVFYEENSVVRTDYAPPSAQTTPPVRTDYTEHKQIEHKNTETQVSKDTTAKPGNQDINLLIESVKAICEKNGWAYDKTHDRRFAHHIMTAKDFQEQAKNCGMTNVQYALAVISASAALPFWRGKITGPAAIYRHHAKIYNDAKEAKSKAAPAHQFDTL